MRAEEALKIIEEQIALLTGILEEIEASIAALTALREKGEALFPLPSGIFVPVKLEEDKVLVGIGGNTFSEKSTEEAIELLKKRKENVKKSLETVRLNRQKLIAKLRSGGRK